MSTASLPELATNRVCGAARIASRSARLTPKPPKLALTIRAPRLAAYPNAATMSATVSVPSVPAARIEMMPASWATPVTPPASPPRAPMMLAESVP